MLLRTFLEKHDWMRLLCLIVCLLSFSAFAQRRGWQEITISDGLSQGMIFDLKQDRKGFIWVATKDGLNRYDGHNFKIFTYDPYNEFSISDNSCSALLIDRKGRLWVGTQNKGLNLYDEKTQRFHHITISDRAVANTSNYEIRILAEDPDGNIWVGTTVGVVFKVQLPASLQERFPEEAHFTSQVRVHTLDMSIGRTKQDHLQFSFNKNGQGLAGLSYGIYTFNWLNPTSFTKRNLFAEQIPDLVDIHDDPQQDFLFVSTRQQIKCWHGGVARSIALPGTAPDGVRIKPIDKNTLAIWSVNQLWLMSPAQLAAKDSLTGQDAFVAFPPDLYAVTSMLRDNTGNIWVGTSGYGIRKFNPRVKQFNSYLPKTSLSQLYVDRQGQTYARSQFAYGRLDRETNQLVPFLDKHLPEADRRQRYFMQDRQGFFWVSNANFQTDAQSLFKFSPTWQLLKKYPLPAGIKFGFWGNKTLEDSSGHLWIGAKGGKLIRFTPQTETFQVFSYRAQPEMETYALVQESDDSFWIGTQQGLIKAEHLLTKPTYSYYNNSTTNRQSLSNDFVLSLANDPGNPARYLWVGTKGGGLNRLDRQRGQFEHFTETEGLPNKVIYGILVDTFRHLWLSTNRGLSQFNPQTGQFRNYTRADGLQDDEFNTNSFFRAASGELLFGGVNGLNIFHPSELSGIDQKTPQVNILGVKVNNKSVEVGNVDGLLRQGIEYTHQLDLSYEQNLLTFEFGVMDYTNPANNQYRYRLAGIDQNWVEAGTNRFANYAQLPDGNYTLEMIGSVDGEHWSKPVELQIRVHPPYYRTWWAYCLYALVLAAIGWLLYRFQKQRWLLQQQVAFEQKEASRLAELDALKTQFFTNISHEFRTPLTLILGPLTALKQQLQTEKVVTLTEPVVNLMERNSNRLLSLINQLLDLSKLSAGQLRPTLETGDIAAFLRTLASSFSSLAESRQIRFSFTQQHDHVQASFDRDKIEKIVTNLLANAFKFTPGGNLIRLRVDYPTPEATGELIITVEDTGIGIAPVDLTHIFERFYQRSADAVDNRTNRVYEGTGIGLSLVKELVSVLGGTITVSSTEGVGTSFTVCLPLAGIAPETIADDLELPETTVRNAAFPAVLTDTTLPAPTTDNVLLIIDDNADIRAYVRTVFESDYHIIEAEDGQDGLEKATASLPNVIICDLIMPRLDGLGFCRLLKQQETTSHIPVVMLTARATVEDRIEGLGLGADDYLTKPFNRAELEARVRNLLQKQVRLQQYYSGRVAVDSAVVSGQAYSMKEKAILTKAYAVVLAQLTESDFGVEKLSQQMNMSQSQLVRKLKALTGQTAVEYIRTVRLEQAAERLRQGENVSEVAYGVGFESLSYFTRVFQEKFGVTPSSYESPVQPGKK